MTTPLSRPAGAFRLVTDRLLLLLWLEKLLLGEQDTADDADDAVADAVAVSQFLPCQRLTERIENDCVHCVSVAYKINYTVTPLYVQYYCQDKCVTELNTSTG